MQERGKPKTQLLAEIKELKSKINELENLHNGSSESAARKESITNLQRWEALFENVDVLLWSVREEPDGILYYEKVNQIFAGVTGRVPSDYDSKPVRELGSEEDLEQIKHSLSVAKRSGVYTYYKSVGDKQNNRTFIIRIISLPPADGIYHYIGSGIDITERIKAEDALKQEKNNVQTYLDIVGVMLLVIGEDEKVRLINRKGCELLGCSEEEVIGKNWFDTFVPKKVREDIRGRFRNLMTGTQPSEYFENPIMSKLGVEKIILWHNTILRDENGKPAGLLGSGEDITERKKVEKELQRHTRTIEALYELSTKISRSSDLDDLLERTTKHFAETPGVMAGAVYLMNDDRNEMLLKKSFGTMKTFFDSASCLPLTNPFVNSVLNSVAVFAEVLFDKKEMDKEIGNRISAAMRRDKEVLGILSMIVKDVDDYTIDFFGLTASEMERSIIRKMSEQELLSTKQILEKITYTSPTFISVFDIPSKKILFSNHSVLESLGYSPEEIARISAVTYDERRYMYHPDDQNNLDEFEVRFATLKDGEINETEYRVKDSNGEWFWFRHLAAVFARNEEGEIVQSVNIMENITVRKRSEQELIETKQLLEKITETSPAIINVFDARTHANIYENRSLIRSLGYSAEIEEYLGTISLQERVRFLFHHDDVPIIDEFYDKIPAMKDGEFYEMEFRMKDAAGGLQWIRRLSSVFHRDEKGVPYQMVSIFENITQSKLTDEKLRQKTDQLICQQASLLELVRMKDFDLDSAFRGISELTSKTLNADRVGIWMFEKDNHQVGCKDLYETKLNFHKNSFHFSSEHFIKYFENLDFDQATIQVQGEIDPGIAEFAQEYLMPFGTTSMLCVRIRMHGETVGVICYETTDPYRMWTIEEQDFVISVSSVISLALEVAERKRTEELLSRRTDQIIRQQAALLELSKMKDYDLKSAFRYITEISCKASNAQRTSIWLFNKDLTEVVCEDIYELTNDTHGDVMRLSANDFAKYFQTIISDKKLFTSEAEKDPRTKDFAEKYLVPFGSTAMLVSRIRLHGDILGFICFESRDPSKKDWSVEEYDFALAVSGYVSIVLETAERKKAETEIKNSLKEKELLLREIHHRVKNNLQVVSSLLYLQSKKVKDQNTLDAFLESQRRVRTMVLVHEKLYQSKDLGRIDYSEYIKSLTGSVFRSYNADPFAIRMNINVKEVYLNLDSAIHCGLIINELVSNSLKHAFPQSTKGEINIDFQHDDKGNYTLKVSDNGVGFPETLNFRETESLGLQLVLNLVEQLEGTIELDKSKGTSFIIKFVQKKHEEGR